jgi:hypothetical protein
VATEKAVEVQTPFGLNVVVPREELLKGRQETIKWPGQFPLDREVIEHLIQLIAPSTGAALTDFSSSEQLNVKDSSGISVSQNVLYEEDQA